MVAMLGYTNSSSAPENSSSAPGNSSSAPGERAPNWSMQGLLLDCTARSNSAVEEKNTSLIWRALDIVSDGRSWFAALLVPTSDEANWTNCVGVALYSWNKGVISPWVMLRVSVPQRFKSTDLQLLGVRLNSVPHAERPSSGTVAMSYGFGKEHILQLVQLDASREDDWTLSSVFSSSTGAISAWTYSRSSLVDVVGILKVEANQDASGTLEFASPIAQAGESVRVVTEVPGAATTRQLCFAIDDLVKPTSLRGMILGAHLHLFAEDSKGEVVVRLAAPELEAHAPVMDRQALQLVGVAGAVGVLNMDGGALYGVPFLAGRPAFEVWGKRGPPESRSVRNMGQAARYICCWTQTDVEHGSVLLVEDEGYPLLPTRLIGVGNNGIETVEVLGRLLVPPMRRGIAVFTDEAGCLASFFVVNSTVFHVEAVASGLAWFGMTRGSDNVWAPVQGPLQVPTRLIDVPRK